MCHTDRQRHILCPHMCPLLKRTPRIVSLCRSMVRARAERRCELCESSIYISLSNSIEYRRLDIKYYSLFTKRERRLRLPTFSHSLRDRVLSERENTTPTSARPR